MFANHNYLLGRKKIILNLSFTSEKKSNRGPAPEANKDRYWNIKSSTTPRKKRCTYCGNDGKQLGCTKLVLFLFLFLVSLLLFFSVLLSTYKADVTCRQICRYPSVSFKAHRYLLQNSIVVGKLYSLLD